MHSCAVLGLCCPLLCTSGSNNRYRILHLCQPSPRSFSLLLLLPPERPTAPLVLSLLVYSSKFERQFVCACFVCFLIWCNCVCHKNPSSIFRNNRDIPNLTSCNARKKVDTWCVCNKKIFLIILDCLPTIPSYHRFRSYVVPSMGWGRAVSPLRPATSP